MKLSELMKNHTPSTSFEGFVTNDDFVLAVDCSAEGNAASVADYAVVQIGVSGLDAQLNPVTQDKQYIRAGQSTTKTGTAMWAMIFRTLHCRTPLSTAPATALSATTFISAC